MAGAGSLEREREREGGSRDAQTGGVDVQQLTLMRRLAADEEQEQAKVRGRCGVLARLLTARICELGSE